MTATNYTELIGKQTFPYLFVLETRMRPNQYLTNLIVILRNAAKLFSIAHMKIHFGRILYQVPV
jgi:hypothetical protein